MNPSHLIIKIGTCLTAFLCAALLYGQSNDALEQPVHGVWVSVVSNIDYPSKPGLTAEELRAEADKWLDLAVEMRFNAIFLQVRPMCDALYRSDLFPWSSFVSGTQGQAPDGDFDPLDYWVKEAHKRNVKLHAWLNPYRVATGQKALEKMATDNPAKIHPEWTFQHKDRTYFDPGIPEVRDLVVKGIVEIVEKYDVDGIHIDDYFYPERKLDEDFDTFEKYGEGFDNIEDWRRHNVDLFIEAADKAIHNVRKDVVWSVSPAGVWANKSNHPLGSDTHGNQCYFDLYADVRGWVKKEIIDAVIPQIYWEFGFKAADFQILADWWSEVVADTNVKLYVGTAAYRVDPNAKSEAWRDGNQLIRQLEYMDGKKEISGQVFFTAHSFKEGAIPHDVVKAYAKEHEWSPELTPAEEK